VRGFAYEFPYMGCPAQRVCVSDIICWVAGTESTSAQELE